MSETATTKDIMKIFASMEYGPVLDSPSQARSWLQEHAQLPLFIGGQWHPSASGVYVEDKEAATGNVLAKVAIADAEDVTQAISAAQSASSQWSAVSGHIRARYLYALARHLQQHATLFAQLSSLDRGEMVFASEQEFAQAADALFYYAGQAQLVEREFADARPLGIAAFILEHGESFAGFMQQMSAALALGNVAIVHVSLTDALVALKFAELIHEIGLPAGVVNILVGEDEQGVQSLISHTDVAAVYYAGKSTTAYALRKQFASSGKLFISMTGDRFPFIVLEDADLDSAVEGVAASLMAYHGQEPHAARVLVQEGIADLARTKLQSRLGKLRSGLPFDRTADLSTVLPVESSDGIANFRAQATKEGLQSWQTGDALLAPALFFDVAPTSQLMKLTTAAPVVLLTTFRTLAEAAGFFSAIDTGQTVSVWSENAEIVVDVTTLLNARTILLNTSRWQEGIYALRGKRGRNTIYAYSRPAWSRKATPVSSPTPTSVQKEAASTSVTIDPASVDALLSLQHAAGHFIAGKQAVARITEEVKGVGGRTLGHVSKGTVSDVRTAVAAAQKAADWSHRSALVRSQILYTIAEYLSAMKDACAQRIVDQTGRDLSEAINEVQVSISRLFSYAAWSTTVDGSTFSLSDHALLTELVEPVGVVGIVTPDDYPLLGLVSLLAPALALGNTTVIVPTERMPLNAIDLYPVLMRAGLPAGVVNIVTGNSLVLGKGLAELPAVAALWNFSSTAADKETVFSEQKRFWLHAEQDIAWLDPDQGEGRIFLRAAARIKRLITVS